MKSDTSETMQMLIEFHRRFGLPMRPTLHPLDPDTPADWDEICLRNRLMTEEAMDELVPAAERGDLSGIADALADIVYVAYGTALTYGIDLDAVLAEVHRSNLTKWPPTEPGGKVTKGDDYSPPDVAWVLATQEPLF